MCGTYVIFNQNHDNYTKHGSCSCWPQNIPKAHNYNYRHSISHPPYKCIVDLLNTSSDCFPERTVISIVELMINYQFITSTMKMTPFFECIAYLNYT